MIKNKFINFKIFIIINYYLIVIKLNRQINFKYLINIRILKICMS